ncbi:MAG: polyhydroxybutyrate depolymerase [Rhodospirillales bacterium]|nr:polyhydroxybutyrate depolymerase [Rhodospirillales bacterium]
MKAAVLAVVAALTVLGMNRAPAHAATDAPGALPQGIADPAGVTVSGVSSGGYMAVQMHVAHSASIAGAGVLAAGPYHCAGDNYPFNLLRAMNTCARMAELVPFMGPPALPPSVEQTQTEATRGRIDDPAHLRHARVYLFSGRLDEFVPQSVTDVLKAYYETFVPPGDIAYVNNIRADHAMISEDFGNPCDTSKDPYINDCDYDAAGALLTQLYGPLAPPGTAEPGAKRALIRFDQTAFDPDAASHGLAAEGYAFIPDGCTGDRRCRLHVAFHGCRQYAGAVGDAFVAHAGYNDWAAANDIVVLYPQTTPLRRRLLGIALPWPNPLGCWDWWGFTGRDFDVKSGAQIGAVWAMVQRLTAGR